MDIDFRKVIFIRIVFGVSLLYALFALIKFFVPNIVSKVSYTYSIYYYSTHECFPHYTNTAFTFIFILPQVLLLLLSIKLYWLLMDYRSIREIITKALNVTPFIHLVLLVVYIAIFIASFCFILYKKPYPAHELNRLLILLRDIFLLIIGLHIAMLYSFYLKKIKELLITKWRELILLLASLIIILFTIESGLRIVFKVTPGVYIHSLWFHPVDTLVCLRGFYADSEGIFKVSPEAAQEIHQEIVSHTPENLPDFPDTTKQIHELYILSRDFLTIFRRDFNNDFSQVAKRTMQKAVKERNELDSAILHYVQYPVNGDGFRSIEMKQLSIKRKKILLLGDSFVWGHAAINKTNSFADILLSKGYVVYNTGISGTDPVQYLAIARKYIPLLKPDVVILNFCMANDIIYFKHTAPPFKPVFYATNAGYLYICPNGIYLNSAKEVYNLILKNYSIPAEKSWFNKICSKTATGTLVWMALYKFAKLNYIPTEYEEYWKKADSLLLKKPYSNIEVDSIRKITENNSAKYVLVAIPDIVDKVLSDPQKIPYLFEGLQYYTSPVKSGGYNLINGHFNDAGHKQYAEFLDSLIRIMP